MLFNCVKENGTEPTVFGDEKRYISWTDIQKFDRYIWKTKNLAGAKIPHLRKVLKFIRDEKKKGRIFLFTNVKLDQFQHLFLHMIYQSEIYVPDASYLSAFIPLETREDEEEDGPVLYPSEGEEDAIPSPCQPKEDGKSTLKHCDSSNVVSDGVISTQGANTDKKPAKGQRSMKKMKRQNMSPYRRH